MYQLRPYQERAIDELFDWFARHPTGNPIIEASVGAGKSILIAELCRRMISMSPATRIVMCVASRELCQQNLDKLTTIWADAPAGVCSASLGSKDLDSQIIFATIGSIARHADKIGRVDVLLIDECHNVNSDSQGMYRTFIDELKRYGNTALCVIGFTGTPFRGNGIWLWQGADPLFHGTACRITMDELLEQGYLAPLVVSKHERPHIDTTGVNISAGDYVIKELSAVACDQSLVQAVMDDFYYAGYVSRSKFLFYCVTTEHAQMVLDALGAFDGLHAHMITADTPKKIRDDTLARYKLPKSDPNAINALVSIGTLTTGFDAPATDCIVLLRPTRSPVLYVQIAGRGMRTADGKKDCLWLDYTDTTETLGAVNRIRGRNKSKDGIGGSGSAPVRHCPECGNSNAISATECAECGVQFDPVRSASHGTHASNAEPIQGNLAPVQTWVDVKAVRYYRHEKAGKTPSLRIDYDIGEYHSVSEWVCIEHTGYAYQKAVQWWARAMPSYNTPSSVDDAIDMLYTEPDVILPSRLLCSKQGHYWRIESKSYDPTIRPQVINTKPSVTDADMPF